MYNLRPRCSCLHEPRSAFPACLKRGGALCRLGRRVAEVEAARPQDERDTDDAAAHWRADVAELDADLERMRPQAEALAADVRCPR
jgi:hypothetical protein